MVSPYNKVPHVAPLAGSVDRNDIAGGGLLHLLRVAPLAGRVDRNIERADYEMNKVSRSPRGERG